jgi:hypothetical protein
MDVTRVFSSTSLTLFLADQPNSARVDSAADALPLI